ncbi:KdsC family phosphatase [Albibacterium profundi]|uniref:HAD-IIIA family hydrolase n=1 Tax=Albibacterium profundi TaxID=3134906 RepID=A0ABV5CH32_9SPHI
MELFERFKKVKAFVFDVDGVLTNGEVLVTEEGEQLRSFSIKDGYALQLAIKKGYPIAIITGGRSNGVKLRLNGLGIHDVFLSVTDKRAVLYEWLKAQDLTVDDLLFMGDDIPDLIVMEEAGIASCPSDAVEEIKEVSQYVSTCAGGKGAVRDVIEKVMKLQGQWNRDTSVKSK